MGTFRSVILRAMTKIKHDGSAFRNFRRRTLAFAAMLALACAPAEDSSNPSPDSPPVAATTPLSIEMADAPRHVVLISFDTTRPDHLGFLGRADARTPRLDALAAESVVFVDATTPAPTTLASHTSVLTGKYPHHHGVARNGFFVHPDNILLTEILNDAGFHTAGFAGSFALDSRFGFTAGFDHWDETFDILKDAEAAVDQNQRSAEEVTNAVIAHLEGLAQAGGMPERLFLFAHYFDPHDPYTPAPGFEAQEDLGEEVLPLRELRRRGVKSDAHLRSAEVYAARYAAEIAYLDHQVGRLLDNLEARGVLDDALIVLTSDHGESFWEHDEETFNHGFTVYQAAVRGLFVMRRPGGEGGGVRIEKPVSTVDILPTLLAQLGMPAPAGIDGVVQALEASETGAPRAIFTQATKPWKQVETDPRWRNLRKARAIREGRYKFVQVPFRKREALYDIEADPLEQTDLLETPTPEIEAVAERLRATLEDWAESADPLPSEFVRRNDDETTKRLQSLGYLQ